jgi:glycine/D-amino acid oxidase-like deaminating enzyme
MPDALPVIDQASIGGLTIATGMSGHGFGIAPGIARIVADLVEQRSSSYSTNRFALNRFAGKKP